MILNDHGIEVPESWVRQATGVDGIKGGGIENALKAFQQWIGDSSYAFKPNTSLAELEKSVQAGKSAIAGINTPSGGSHAIVIDDITGGLVYIRDPLGDSYSVRIADFLSRWGGRAVFSVQQ